MYCSYANIYLGLINFDTCCRVPRLLYTIVSVMLHLTILVAKPTCDRQTGLTQGRIIYRAGIALCNKNGVCVHICTLCVCVCACM